jgi:uncharacterized delta-60 repeat protein
LPRLRTLAVLIVLLAVPAAPALALPGDLDPGFDGDGKKILAGIGLDYAEAVLVQPDGKIVVAGYPSNAPFDFVVARLNPDGSLDNGFDGDGVTVADFGDSESAQGAALQPDGRIVVAGYTLESTNRNVAVARFNPNGSLDTSFDPGGADGAGKRTIDYGGSDEAEAVLVQPDGKILLGGNGGWTNDLVVARLHPDGSDDTSFDGDGAAGADFGGDDLGYGVALQADGRVVVAGRTPVNADVAVARFNRTGLAGLSLDDSFADDGTRTIDYAGADGGRAVLLQPDRKLVVAGYGGGNTALVATRLNADGSEDTSFDEDGTSGADFGGADRAHAALLQPNGKVVLVGGTSVNEDIAVARLQPGGMLDTTFSFDGKNTVNVGGTSDYGNAAGVQADGKIVIAGETRSGAALVRLEGDPPPDGGGGGGGPGGRAGARTRVPRCAGKPATIVGTVRRDRLRGTRRADVIVALGGRDRISALGGADLVCGGRGDDRLSGGAGPDRLRGQQGRDRLSGGPGKDRLAGGPQRDRCIGGPARDRAQTCETRRR